MTDIAVERLKAERRAWRKSPHFGFSARPAMSPNGRTDWTLWECSITGRLFTPWQGGIYNFELEFPVDYPNGPPICTFTPPLFHPNIAPDGSMIVSLIDEERKWRPSVTIPQILLAIDKRLHKPKLLEPAAFQPCYLYKRCRSRYDNCIQAQAKMTIPRN